MSLLTAPPLIKDLPDDATVECVYLIGDVERREKRDGTPFLRLTLSDRSGSVAAVLWRAEADDEPTVERGIALRIRGRLTDHPRYGRQITVDALDEPAAHEIDWSRLIAGPSRPIEDLLASIHDPGLAHLLGRLLGPDTALGLAFRRAPAAKYNHHAYPHGLLEHSLQVAELVEAARLVQELDRDVALSGALLHDIGKLDASSSSGAAADLTDRGKLEGEIPLGYYRVRRELEEHGDVTPELGEQLLHVILAHHGHLEFGSPVVPWTREAAVVHAMDNLSGTLGAFDRLERETPGEQRWSRFDRVPESSAFFGQR